MNTFKRCLLGLCLGGMLCFSSVHANAATDYSYTPKTQQVTPTPAPTAQSAVDYYKEIGNDVAQNNKINAVVLIGLCGALFVVMFKNKTLITKRRK